MPLIDQVCEVVSVVGCCDLVLGDAQTCLEVLTDSVDHRLRREAALLERLRPPGGEFRPRRFLLVSRLNRREELALFRVEPFHIQRPSRDRLKYTPLHCRLAPRAAPRRRLRIQQNASRFIVSTRARGAVALSGGLSSGLVDICIRHQRVEAVGVLARRSTSSMKARSCWLLAHDSAWRCRTLSSISY